MADDPKSVAERLGEFVKAAEKEASSSGVQGQVHGGPMSQPTNPSKTPRQVYERCLSTLTPDERSEFARILEKMLSAGRP